MQRYRKTQFVVRHHLLSAPTSQEVRSPTGNSSCVVALSFAEEDIKAALAMKELLIEGCPTLQISEPRTNATSRLKALDAAEVIIIMLSPAYMNSTELVEELNIALYRHRMTAHQVVYPIQLAPLPTKPTYIHMLPCDFSAMDFPWKLKVYGNLMDISKMEHLAQANDIDASVASCMLDASELILKRLTDPGYYTEHTQVLVNNLEVQKVWNEIRERLSKEKGYHHLKLSFGVELTNEENDHSAVDTKTTPLHMDTTNNAGKKPKTPVEQDETEQEEHKEDATVEEAASSHHLRQETTTTHSTDSEVHHTSHGAHKESYDLQQDKQAKAKSCVIV